MRYDLFISYASNNRTIAIGNRKLNFIAYLKRLLERHRVPRKHKSRPAPFRVCTYEEDFAVGQPLPDEIRAQLDECACLLVVCSRASAASHYVRLEVDYFIRTHDQRPVVAGYLDIPPHQCFPEFFATDTLVAGLGHGANESFRAWKRKVEAESHKIVAASVKMPVAAIHDRFRYNRRLTLRIATLGVLGVAFLTGWEYQKYRHEAYANEARLYLQNKGVAFDPWKKQGWWVRAENRRAFQDSDLFRLNPVHKIENLDLEATSITDNSLKAIAGHSELTALSLGFTHLTPSRLFQLRELKNLEDLDLTGIPLTDADIEFLPVLSHLSELRLNGTRITDSSLDVLSKLHQLRRLDLEMTDIGDSTVAKLTALDHLDWLALDGTKITDEALPRLAALPLKAFGLNSTAISDRSILVLVKMTTLEQLWIADTAISFKGVLQLSRLAHLRRLVVHREQFSSRQLASLQKSFGEKLTVVDWERPLRRVESF